MSLAESLHVLERQILPLLKTAKTVPELAAESKLPEVSVVRALQWLEKKKLVATETTTDTHFDVTERGKQGLPEKAVLALVLQRPQAIKDLAQIQGGQAAIGVLRQQNLVIVKEGSVEATAEASKATFPEESLLKKMPCLPSKDDKGLAQSLQRRGLIAETTKKTVKAFITDAGKNLVQKGIASVVDQLTPTMLQDGSWKGKNFRRYDLTSIAPRLHGGKLQPYKKFLDSVRKQFIALGFEEMDGPVVESDFWDMDALYMPQFHSARDIHEGYYVKNAPPADVEEGVMKRVKEAHEKGVEGSSGWQYDFDVNHAKRQLLRTQGTACSARMLANPNLKIPGKYFAISRCFRYDVIDSTHLPDFNQVEGIVVDKNLTLRHMIGLLKQFAKIFAHTDEVKVVPGYFPFTEPSVELFAKHPELGWIELGGAGVCRPGVVQPLVQKDVQVLAWGIGVDRLGMFNLGIKDIRNLFSKDLAYLRKAKV